MNIKRRLSAHKNFIEKAKILYQDIYGYDSVNYINGKTLIKIFCTECKEYFYRTPESFLKGAVCPNCHPSKNGRKTLKSFIEKAITVHGNKYNYDEVNYKDSTTKVLLKCPKHGYFLQTPKLHISGKGCPECGKENKALHRKYTKEEFIEKAKKIHKDKYNYDNIEYVSCLDKITIICKKHGPFLQKPYAHLKGDGCPKCNKSKGELAISNFLDDNKIKYFEQYKFLDCKDKRSLPFDFYLPEYNICIEYQGRQHYSSEFYQAYFKKKKDVKFWFRKQIFHDQIKREYCKKNNLMLLEIKYNEDINFILNKALLKPVSK